MKIREVVSLPFKTIDEIKQKKRAKEIIIWFQENTNLINSHGNGIRKFIFMTWSTICFSAIIYNIYNIVSNGIKDNNYLILLVIPIAIIAMGTPNAGSKKNHRTWLLISFILLIIHFFINNQTIKGILLGFSVSYFLMLFHLSTKAAFNYVISTSNLSIFTECWENRILKIYDTTTNELIEFTK